MFLFKIFRIQNKWISHLFINTNIITKGKYVIKCPWSWNDKAPAKMAWKYFSLSIYSLIVACLNTT